MVVPTYRHPGYGAAFGSSLSEGAAGRLQSMIDSRGLDVDVLKSLMNNSEKIAGIAGSSALDRIAQQEGGADQPMFGGDYATWADTARQSLMAAEIGSKNRSGTGGGGGGGDDAGGGELKVGQFVGTDGRLYKWSDWDTTAQQNIAAGRGPNGLGIAIGGPMYTGAMPAAPPVPTGTPPPATSADPTAGFDQRIDPATGKKQIANPGTDEWFDIE